MDGPKKHQKLDKDERFKFLNNQKHFASLKKLGMTVL